MSLGIRAPLPRRVQHRRPAPAFLLAAPDYEVQLLLATQVADEHRHIEAVLRVYSDVFAVKGGIAAVKALADAKLDPVAARSMRRSTTSSARSRRAGDEDSFLKPSSPTT